VSVADLTHPYICAHNKLIIAKKMNCTHLRLGTFEEGESLSELAFFSPPRDDVDILGETHRHSVAAIWKRHP
jgi:hypothetical protein